MRAHDRGGGRDQRIVMRILTVAACTPAIGERIGIEDVGGAHARAVMEGGAQHAVGQLLLGDLARAHLLQSAGSLPGQQRILGHVDLDGNGLRRRAAFDDRLGQNREAHEGIDHHQRGQRHLGAQRGASRVEDLHGLDVREIDRRDVADEDRRHRGEPGKPRVDDRDIHAVARRAEQIPAEAEGVRRQRNDVLPLDEQEREIMREVIADRDRNQCEGEAARKFERRQALLRNRAHNRADPDIGATKHQPEGE